MCVHVCVCVHVIDSACLRECTTSDAKCMCICMPPYICVYVCLYVCVHCVCVCVCVCVKEFAYIVYLFVFCPRRWVLILRHFLPLVINDSILN